MDTTGKPRILLAALAVTGCLVAAGCGSSNSARHTTPVATTPMSASRAPNSSQTPAGTTITIKNFGYDVSGTAAGGSMVMVTNNDSEAHTVTANSGHAFDLTIQPGDTEMFTAPTAAGNYKFHCKFHSTMLGTLVVGS